MVLNWEGKIMRALILAGCAFVVGALFSSSGLVDAQETTVLFGSVNESARDIPVAYDVDVLVVGGASRAVAAAMSAAQQGAKVFLAAPRVYLGEDLCSTYRLWLDPNEVLTMPLAKALYAEPARRLFVENALPFTYTTDLPSADPHQDTPSNALLCDGKWHSAPSQSVQYNGDVTLSADLDQVQEVEAISVLVYQRPGDFEVADIRFETSTDGEHWDAAGLIKNSQSGLGFEQQAAPLSCAVGRDVRYVRFEVHRAQGTQRVLLGEIFIQGRTDSKVSRTSYSVPPTPMQVKRVLDQALLDHDVQFLYGCCPTEVLVDSSGELAGIVMANRSGRQAVKAKVIIDATPMATVARLARVPFERRDMLRCQFQRMVVGGEPTVFSNDVVRQMPVPVSGHDGRLYNAYEYTFSRPWDGRSFASLAEIEQAGKDLTWQKGQVDASERLFFVPPECLDNAGEPCQTWPGAARADLSLFKPEKRDRLYILNGSAFVSSDVAKKILRPVEAMHIGQRLGRAAARDAAAMDVLVDVTVRSEASTGAIVQGDIGDDPAWTPPLGKTLGVVHSPARSVPVVGSYDVVVVGGGTGGAPAGISAARQGAKTLVVEYLHGLGGIGTLGMISKYYHGYRKGFTEEIDAGLADLGGADEGKSGQGQAWDTQLKAEWFRRELRKAGAHIWFGTLGCGAFTHQGKVKGVVVATPEGRGVVLARVVIDATGHAGIAAAAGAACVYTGPAHIAIQGTGLPPLQLGARYTNTDYTFVDDLDVYDMWRTFVTSREKFKNAYDLGQLIDTRERRQIEGDYFLSPLDAYLGRTFPDTIVMAKSNFDSHGFTIHPMFMIRPPDRESVPTSVPYRCLLPKGLEGILVTGLGVSAHRDVMPVIRMQPDIQNQGYAAGLAAATAVKKGMALRDIDIRTLQQALVKKGILSSEVLTQDDIFPLPYADIVQAVQTVIHDYEGLEKLFVQPDRALPLLREAYRRTELRKDKFTYAHILAILGDPIGAEDLAEGLRSRTWDKGWQYRGMGQFGPSLSDIDSLIIALGRTHASEALAPILDKVQQLGPEHAFSHHRAVAMALEIQVQPQAARALAQLLAKPDMTGHAFTSIEKARENIQPSSTDNTTREHSLRELVLARALYRCGDFDGLGEEILREYAKDLRGHYRRHAQAILNEKIESSPDAF